MTSIIGMKIKTPEEHEFIIIGADTQKTYYEEAEAVRKKNYHPKIWYGENWAIARTGGAEESEALQEFKETLLGPIVRKKHKPEPKKVAEIIQKAITPNEENCRIFPEVVTLNQKLSRDGIKPCDWYEFVFATSKPELSLWYVDSIGNLATYEECCRRKDEKKSKLEYVTLGSGEQTLSEYITKRISDSEEPLDLKNIAEEGAFMLVREALCEAETDIATGGRDIVVLTASETWAYGKRIREAQIDAEVNSLKEGAQELYDAFEKKQQQT